MNKAAAQEIKSRLPLLELVMGYIPVEASGRNYRAKCPFHNEKTASFYISPERESYYCFGCNKKGDIFSFVEEYEGVDFKTALVKLAERTGVTLNNNSYVGVDTKKESYNILEDATIFFEKNLSSSLEAKEYLEKRGLNEATIKKFRIGYAPKEWEKLSKYLLQKGYTQKALEDNGLSKQGNHGIYDRFRGRIMFPFTDSSGRIIGFSGRIVTNNSKEAKYINSPETSLFKKGSIVFGLYQAKEAIRTKKKVLVVEGQMDVCLVAQSGVSYVIGSSGTAFSGALQNETLESSHLGIIKRFTTMLYFAFDADKAGVKAMYQAAKEGLKVGFKPYCLHISNGKDPADYVASGKSFIDLIENSKPSIIYFTLLLIDLKDSTLLQKGIKEKIWPLIYLLKSPIEESYIITMMSGITGIKEQVLLDDYNAYVKKNKLNKENEQFQGSAYTQEPFESLFGLVFYLEEHNQDLLAQVKEKVVLITEDDNFFESKRIMHVPKKEERLFAFEKTLTNESFLEKDTKFILNLFEKEYLESKLYNLKESLKEQNTNQSNNTLQEIVVITKKLKQHEKSN